MQNEKREEKGKKNVWTVGVMILLTLLGKILGLLRDMMLGRNFATGAASSAFLAASRIPRNFFDAIFASAISASFIPVFNEYLEKKGKEEAFRLSNAFLTVTALATTVLSVLGMFFSKELTAFLADGFPPDTATLCTLLLRILFPTVLFTGIAFSMVGILQSLGEFYIPALLSTVSNVVILLYYVLFCRRFGIKGLAIAFLLGWMMQVVIQIPSLWRLGYRFRPSLHHEGLRKILLLMLPVMGGTWIQPLNLTVAAKYASRLYEGAGAAAMEYANTLYTIVAGVFVLSIANVIFPELSRLSAREEEKALGETLGGTLRTMLYFLTPMTVGLAVLARPIVRLLYEWGAWGAESTALTSDVLAFLSFGMIGYGIQIILSRAYYAAQKGMVPLLSGLASVGCNLLLCIFLTPKFGLRGLAAASSASAMLSALLLLLALCRRQNSFRLQDVFGEFWKTALSAGAMGLLVYLLRIPLEEGYGDGVLLRVLTVVLPTVVGVALYLLLSYLLRISTLQTGIQLLHMRKRKISENGGKT